MRRVSGRRCSGSRAGLCLPGCFYARDVNDGKGVRLRWWGRLAGIGNLPHIAQSSELSAVSRIKSMDFARVSKIGRIADSAASMSVVGSCAATVADGRAVTVASTSGVGGGAAVDWQPAISSVIAAAMMGWASFSVANLWCVILFRSYPAAAAGLGKGLLGYCIYP